MAEPWLDADLCNTVSLRAYFRGEAHIAYPETGVEFELQCPLSAAGTVSE